MNGVTSSKTIKGNNNYKWFIWHKGLQCITVQHKKADDFYMNCWKLRRESNCTTHTDRRRIAGRVQTHPMCWRCLLKWPWSVLSYPAVYTQASDKSPIAGAPKEETQGNDTIRAWRTSNKPAGTNPPPATFGTNVVNRKMCWCTIMHVRHVLAHSSRYSLHEIQKDVLLENMVPLERQLKGAVRTDDLGKALPRY